jgi:HSP20 family protein
MAMENWLPTLWNDKGDRRDPFQVLRKQMDDVFADWATAWPRAGLPMPATAFEPKIDVSETDKAIIIKADLPGVEQKDLDVALMGNRLTIKGEKKSEIDEKKDEKGLTFHRTERTYGAFQRTMALPFEIEPAKVEAAFKDGVLTVTVPKSPEAQKQTKRIEIKKAA